MKKIPKVKPITRSFHCKKCEEAKSPKVGDMFITIGGTGRIKLHECIGGGVIGITPHLIQFVQETKDLVEIRVACSIHDCGVDIFHDEDFNDFEFDILETRNYKISKGDWRELQGFKEKDYYIWHVLKLGSHYSLLWQTHLYS